jgi:hypothetical protein
MFLNLVLYISLLYSHVAGYDQNQFFWLPWKPIHSLIVLVNFVLLTTSLHELKLDFPSELESFVKDVSKFRVVSVTEKHCSTSLVKEVELQAQIRQENKLGVIPQNQYIL